jgi:hypothetical protein
MSQYERLQDRELRQTQLAQNTYISKPKLFQFFYKNKRENFTSK